MIDQFAYCLSFTAYIVMSLALYTEKACMPNSSFPGQYQTIRSLLGSRLVYWMAQIWVQRYICVWFMYNMYLNIL